MNKNRENYKKAIDQIHVDQNLKDRVLEEAKSKEKTKSRKTIYYLRYAVSLAAIAVVAVVGINFAGKNKDEVLNSVTNDKVSKKDKDIALENVDIKRFKSTQELREILKEYEDTYTEDLKGMYNLDSFDSSIVSNAVSESTNGAADIPSKEDLDYSKTNNQVENVDEADIVKTDGKYIYYTMNNIVYIIDKDLNLISKIEDDDFTPCQLFINGDKLVVFGDTGFRGGLICYDLAINTTSSYYEEDDDECSLDSRQKTYARVYDLNDIKNPEMIRNIEIDGYYQDARMIEDNIYFISDYNIYFYKGLDKMTDKELLPSYKDTNISKDTKLIDVENIAYFEDGCNHGYSIIAGFNLNSDKEVNIETFFGFGQEMYVSENNMYLVCTKYKGYYDLEEYSVIYKFKLENSNIIAQTSGTVKGYVNGQFSIDEYEGNLRIATTSYNSSYSTWRDEYKSYYSTHLTIFDENLEEIGEIDDLIKDERIYAVRFIGNVGYIVTFEEIDPLWVIDLSDPTNPVVKGQLEIPGYSSYLHPYDETHIIGIGYDVKSNGYGGLTNDTIKLSMFDVSDLENPKEIFKINFNSKNAYSDIMYEHKALFFNKDENLIGFPVEVWGNRRENKAGILLYRIDLENNKFEEIKSLLENTYNNAERSLYIGENIYVLYTDMISQYDLKTFDKKGFLDLDAYDY